MSLRDISLIFFLLMEAWSSKICQGVYYLFGSHFIAIRIHRGQNVDACIMDQSCDSLVSCPILLAQKLGELNEQLTAEHFVAVHVAHVLELWLHWRGSGEVEGQCEVKKPHTAAMLDIKNDCLSTHKHT